MEKSEKEHFLYVPEGRAPVSKSVFDTWWKFENKENYFLRRLKEQGFIYDPEKMIAAFTPSREDSLERLLEEGSDFDSGQQSVEEQVETSMLMEKLMKRLSQEEKEILYRRFALGETEDSIASSLHLKRTTFQYFQEAIFAKCRGILENSPS